MNDNNKIRMGNISRMCEHNVMGFQFNNKGILTGIGGCNKAKDFRRRPQ